MPEEKLVRKTLRNLQKRFTYKVTAIKEAKNVKNLILEEIIGSLRTFEMNLEEEKFEKKNKGIFLKAEMQRAKLESSVDEDEELAESIA